MVRLSTNSIRAVGDTDDGSVDGASAGAIPADAIPADATPGDDFDEAAARVPDHVGAWLREARESTGRDLRDVAGHLRIRYPYLLAIEEGRFDDLPGRAYAAGFIRSYAADLGLDGEAMVARFKADADAIAVEQNLKFPTPAPEGRFPGRSVMLVSVILAAALIGGWYYYQSRSAIGLDRVPPPPPQAASTLQSGTSTPPPVAVLPTPVPPAEPALAESAPATETAKVADEPVPVVAPSPSSVSDPAMPENVDNTPVGIASPQAEAGGAATAPTPVQLAEPQAAEPVTADVPVAEVPSVEVLATDVPAAEVTVGAPPVAQTMQQTPLAPDTVPSDTVPSDTEPPAQTAALPAVPTVQSEAGETARVYGLSNSDARVVLTARGDSWVQVRDAEQNALLTRMLQTGDSYHVPNRPGLVLSVGNPSVLAVSVDGEAEFQLSGENVPMSDIALDPERLRDGTAVR